MAKKSINQGTDRKKIRIAIIGSISSGKTSLLYELLNLITNRGMGGSVYFDTYDSKLDVINNGKNLYHKLIENQKVLMGATGTSMPSVSQMASSDSESKSQENNEQNSVATNFPLSEEGARLHTSLLHIKKAINSDYRKENTIKKTVREAFLHSGSLIKVESLSTGKKETVFELEIMNIAGELLVDEANMDLAILNYSDVVSQFDKFMQKKGFSADFQLDLLDEKNTKIVNRDKYLQMIRCLKTIDFCKNADDIVICLDLNSNNSSATQAFLTAVGKEGFLPESISKVKDSRKLIMFALTKTDHWLKKDPSASPNWNKIGFDCLLGKTSISPVLPLSTASASTVSKSANTPNSNKSVIGKISAAFRRDDDEKTSSKKRASSVEKEITSFCENCIGEYYSETYKSCSLLAPGSKTQLNRARSVFHEKIRQYLLFNPHLDKSKDVKEKLERYLPLMMNIYTQFASGPDIVSDRDEQWKKQLYFFTSCFLYIEGQPPNYNIGYCSLRTKGKTEDIINPDGTALNLKGFHHMQHIGIFELLCTILHHHGLVDITKINILEPQVKNWIVNCISNFHHDKSAHAKGLKSFIAKAQSSLSSNKK